jgi:cbb3-type cytochrome oxidase maturation protein
MTALFILIPVSILLSLTAFIAFRWAVAKGQFDDLDQPAYEILRDDKKV